MAGRLTADQITALKAGNPIKQLFYGVTPTSSAHSAYIEVLFETGLYAARTVTNRVTRAGQRKVAVWNPHPQETTKPKAPRWTFEVQNSDGYFFRGPGSVWDPVSLYDAEPEECRIKHIVQVRLNSGSWSTLAPLTYTGKVIRVTYTPTADAAGDPQGSRAAVTCEQLGAWDVLLEVFATTHGDTVAINDGTNPAEWTYT